jgi:hypothetical protein
MSVIDGGLLSVLVVGISPSLAAVSVIARDEAIQRPVYIWIASFLAMTTSADGKQ